VIRQSESISALCAALVAAQAEMPGVPKATRGQVGTAIRFYADLSSVLEVVQPVLAKHKLGFVQFPYGGTGGSVTVITRIFHESGEWMECEASMPTGGNGAQGVGSATTYQKRYSLMAVLGLATEDDDGKAASAPAQRQQRAPRQEPPPPAEDRPADPNAISPQQLKKLQALANEKGYTERTRRLEYWESVLGRKVETANDLNKTEAARLIDAMEALPNG